MLSLSINHPDILSFINCKEELGNIEKANISVRIDNDFMEAVKNDQMHTTSFTRPETGETTTFEIPAKELFMKICYQAWNTAEPGVLFWDEIKSYNMLHNNSDFEFSGINP